MKVKSKNKAATSSSTNELGPVLSEGKKYTQPSVRIAKFTQQEPVFKYVSAAHIFTGNEKQNQQAIEESHLTICF